MKPYEKFLHNASALRELLDVYLELRQHLQELGFKESELEKAPIYTPKMINLQEKFQNKFSSLINLIKDYGFDVTKNEIIEYVTPLLQKINELTPLDDGSNKRRD